MKKNVQYFIRTQTNNRMLISHWQWMPCKICAFDNCLMQSLKFCIQGYLCVVFFSLGTKNTVMKIDKHEEREKKLFSKIKKNLLETVKRIINI